MDKIIGEIISKVPNLIWPVIIALSMYGLVMLVIKVHGHYLKTKKSYVDELREHLDFKGQRLEEYIQYTSNLEEQNRIQSSLAQENLTLAVNINQEKEMIQHRLTNSLMMSMWMYEREKFVRRIVTTLLSHSSYPPDILEFLNNHIDDLFKVTDSNDLIHFFLSQPQKPEGFTDHIVSVLNNSYGQFSINDEQKEFAILIETIQSLPSFSNSSEVAATSEEQG